MKTNTPKATTKVFEQACALYDEIGKLANQGIGLDNDTTGTYETFNRLMEEYDFDPYVFEGEDGKKGLCRCDGIEILTARYDLIFVLPGNTFSPENQVFLTYRDLKEYLVNHCGDDIFTADEIKLNNGFTTPAIFREGDKWGIVFSNGNVFVKPKYDRILFWPNGFFEVVNDGKYGLITPMAEMLDAVYDSVDFDEDGYIVVTKDDNKFFIDETGNLNPDEDEKYLNVEMYID